MSELMAVLVVLGLVSTGGVLGFIVGRAGAQSKFRPDVELLQDVIAFVDDVELVVSLMPTVGVQNDLIRTTLWQLGHTVRMGGGINEVFPGPVTLRVHSRRRAGA